MRVALSLELPGELYRNWRRGGGRGRFGRGPAPLRRYLPGGMRLRFSPFHRMALKIRVRPLGWS